MKFAIKKEGTIKYKQNNINKQKFITSNAHKTLYIPSMFTINNIVYDISVISTEYLFNLKTEKLVQI